MDHPGNLLKNLSEGLEVEINPQNDRTRKKRVKGLVKKILTRTPEHTYGILVELDNGEIGRVKEILGPLESSAQTIEQEEKVLKEKFPDFDLEKVIEDPKEDHFVEFKTSILWSVRLTDQQIQEATSFEIKRYGRGASKFIIAKTIASFLNSDGGHLIVGVKENKAGGDNEIVGIESEFFKLQDQCLDGYRRMIVDQIIKIYFPTEVLHHIKDYLGINFKEINGKTVCLITIRPSKSKIFINYNKKGHFFIRIDASSRELQGEDIVDYCLKRFVP